MEIFQTNSSFSPCHMTAKDQLTETRKEEKILLNWNLISFKKKICYHIYWLWIPKGLP